MVLVHLCRLAQAVAVVVTVQSLAKAAGLAAMADSPAGEAAALAANRAGARPKPYRVAPGLVV